MHNFRTSFDVKRSPFTVALKDPILTIGSCFSDMIGKKLSENKLTISSNPFGTIYNPISIHKVLRYSVYNELPAQHTFILHNDVYSNYDFHSSFSSLQAGHVERKVKEAIGFNHFFLKDCKFLVITYGTAWTYERNDTKEIVANCHKVPAKNFSKHLLQPADITDSFNSLYKELKEFNPNIKIILTVSPVRHIKETLELNSVSKAILRLACHTISENNEDVEYFPAYELLMDDLRDYRFYASDMIHPSQDAEGYIWEKFKEKYFNTETIRILDQWRNVQTALAHRPFHPKGTAHQRFLTNTLQALQELESSIDVSSEIKFIKDQINP